MKKIKLVIILFILFSLILLPKISLADSFQDGVKAYNSGDYNYAEACFKRAFRANPNNDAIKYYLAITFVQNKNISDAKILYKNIIQTSSNQEVINYSRTGLKLLGDNSANSLTKVILNVNAVGTVLIVSGVNLNDTAKVNFIFDTGASYVTISNAVARKLGVSTFNSPKIKIMTGSGYVYAPKVMLKKIEVNGLAAYNVEVIITDLPMHTSGTAGNVAGLLGLSFLKNFKFTVDRSNSQIVLEKN